MDMKKRTPMNDVPDLDQKCKESCDCRKDLEKQIERIRFLLIFPTYFALGAICGKLVRLILTKSPF